MKFQINEKPYPKTFHFKINYSVYFNAYLTYSHTILDQHQDMLQNYLSVMSDELIRIYPNLAPIDAYALAWGGLEKDNATAFNSLSDVDKNHIALANLYCKTAQKGTPCN